MNFENLSTIELADKVLPFFNDHDRTNLYKPFLNFGFTENDLTGEYQRLMYDTINVLKTSLKYIEPQGDSGQYFLLSPLGRQVKNAGGHFAYLKKIEYKDTAEKERQELNDEKLKYDIKNSKRIFKTYWWTFGIAIAGFIIALGLGILKLIEVLNVSHLK